MSKHENISFAGFLNEAGEMSAFAARFFRELAKGPFELGEFIRQSFEIGYKSLPLIVSTGFIMGLVITIQSHPAMEAMGTESWLPSVVSVSLVREIVPVISALIFAGKIGSGIGAELGSMKVTEQIDAMEVSGTNPFKYLVVTRILAATFTLPMLVVIANTISLYGAFIGVNITQVISFNLYWNQVFTKLDYGDILPAIIKSVFFGWSIAVVGCYLGFNTRNGTEGVGRSANIAVVVSTFFVFIIDLLSAQLSDILKLT